jgi:hypothetical protein
VTPAALWRGLDDDCFLDLGGLDKPDESFPCVHRRGDAEHFGGNDAASQTKSPGR